MKIKTNTLLFLTRSLAFTIFVVAAMVVLSSEAYAVGIQTTYRSLSAGQSDFGGSSHASGVPVGDAAVTFDWSTATGQLISTGRVRGTLYWDALFSGGCSRLTIRFLNASRVLIQQRVIDECGPGGDANNAANKTVIDESLSSVNLFTITLRLDEVGTANSRTADIGQTSLKSYSVLIENGTADFGRGNHNFGRPERGGLVSFQRSVDGTLTAGVDGVLFWDSFGSESCSRLRTEHRSFNGAILRNRTFLNCGPGGNANDGANQFFISEVFTSGSVHDIRLRLDNSTTPFNLVTQTYGFAGLVGDFEVSPETATVSVGELINYGFTWTVPEPFDWHDLESMDFRIVDGARAILRVRFEEQGNMIRVFNEATGEYGRALPIGTRLRLQTPFATLNLANTSFGPVNSVLGVGAASPSVKINLPLAFKPSAAGKTYTIEVAARDDLGNEDPFAIAGTLTIP